MSGEHIISNALFKAGCGCPPVVEGVKRIRGGEPTKGAEKSNILCRHHNSLLSPLDSTIGKISNFQAQANDESFEGALWLEGELLERWLLKTAVNTAAAGWLGPQKLLPSDDIVRAIYGLEPVPNKIGLYSVEGICPTHQPRGGASFKPINLKTPFGLIFGGAYISVNGMPLFASFNTDLTERLEQGDAPELLNYYSEKGLKHLWERMGKNGKEWERMGKNGKEWERMGKNVGKNGKNGKNGVKSLIYDSGVGRLQFYL